MEKTDSELIYNALEGDDTAFKELLERHLKRVYNFVYRLSGNTEESKDITQDTFVKIWKNLKKYKKEFSFKTWIINIAKNTTIDYLRKKKAFTFSDFDNIDSEESFEEKIVDTEPLADELFEKEENKILAEKILLKIPMQKRMIILMHINEELSFEEIAKILNKPTNTIKSQYRRALLELKKNIENAPN